MVAKKANGSVKEKAGPGWENKIVRYGDADPKTLNPNPNNFREHPPEQMDALKEMLDKVGWVQNVIYNIRTEHLLDGHLRVDLAIYYEEKLVPTTYVDMSEEEELLALLTLDRVASLAEINKDILGDLLKSNDGFTDGEDEAITKLLNDMAKENNLDFGEPLPEDPGAEMDKAEELREKWGVASGQLWQLGEHRIICGDCTDEAVVDRLMDGERVSLIVTDPPYGVGYEGGANNAIKRTKLRGDEDAELYRQFLKVAPMNEECALYMWHAGRRANEVYDAAISGGFEVRSQIIWHKLKAHYGAWMAQYKQKHEPCIYCVRGAPKFTGQPTEVTVWEYDQPSRNENHPTEKPIELMERPIGNHSYSQVYDPFLGSGTTLIACERLSRKCYGIEVEPKYIGVTLERWSEMTGETPVLLDRVSAK